MRRSIAGVIVMALGTGIIFQAGLSGPARGANFVYLEDFSDSSYCDPLNTTALWDTLAGTVGLRYHGLSIAGSYPTAGSVRTVAVEGDVAYIISGGSSVYVLIAVDITDPSAPSFLGSVQIPCWMPIVTVDGDYAYVVGYNGCFFTVDVSDPTAPTIITETAIYGAYPIEIEVVGNYAYASMDGVVVSVNISDPASPSQSGYVAMNNSLGFNVHGDYMIVNCGYLGTRTIDISDPTDLAVVDTCFACLGYNAAVSGDHGILAYGSDIYVADISDPENIAYVSNSSSASDANYVSVCGDAAFVSDQGGDGLILYDISDPASPERIDNIAVGSYATQSVVRGRHVYVGSSSGLYIVEVSVQEELVQVADVGLAEATRVFAVGDHAFVTGLSHGINTIDISDPLNPALAAHQSITGACDLEIRGDNAFVARGATGLPSTTSPIRNPGA